MRTPMIRRRRGIPVRRGRASAARADARIGGYPSGGPARICPVNRHCSTGGHRRGRPPAQSTVFATMTGVGYRRWHGLKGALGAVGLRRDAASNRRPPPHGPRYLSERGRTWCGSVAKATLSRLRDSRGVNVVFVQAVVRPCHGVCAPERPASDPAAAARECGAVAPSSGQPCHAPSPRTRLPCPAYRCRHVR